VRQAEAKYRALFENALIGIFQTTPDGRVLAANRTMARILGYDSSEDLLANLRDVRTGLYADPAVRPRLLERLEAEGALEDLEVQVRRKDGEIVWVSVNVRADRDPDGRLVRIEGACHDITERRRAEEALRQVSARLLRSQDQERRRIARELHDGTAQMLAALGMNLEALRKGSGQVTGAGRARLAGSRRLLEQCVQEIRTLAYLLHPPLLDEAGLITAIRSYARGFSERSGIRVDVRLPRAAGRLPDEIELTLFRVVQESLSNIHRHSGSPVARIGMGRHNGRVRLVVRDQGRGMGAARTRIGVAGPAPGIGVGIAGMRERVRHLGGDLIIDLSPRGTTVKVSLPV
jgi:PAS domain S-box-containing protein